jgi:hypothetical protein
VHHISLFKYSYFFYFLANNLYGSSMMMEMPVGNYRFLEEGDSRLSDIEYYFELVEKCHQDGNLDEMPDWSDIPATEGFFIEVDVEYPKSRHDYMRDLPPAPAPTTIRQDDLSEHYKHVWRCRYGENGQIPDSEKLIASLVDKKGKLIHGIIHSHHQNVTPYYRSCSSPHNRKSLCPSRVQNESLQSFKLSTGTNPAFLG